MSQNMQGILEQVPYSNEFTLILYTNNTSESYAAHWHPSIEIIMPIENSYEVTTAGNHYKLAEEDIIIIPPGELHELIAPKTGSRLILLIDHSLITSLKGMSSILPVLRTPRVIKKSDVDIHSNVMNLLLQIKREYAEKIPLWEASIYSKMIQFFLLIGRKSLTDSSFFAESKQSKQTEYIEKFDMIFDYIHNNYMKEITLDTIAGIANFSKFHFSRLFKQFTNMSFYDYLNKERIQVAETLLLNPELSITEVAFQSGFSSISTFNRVFKNIKKCSPTEFRSLYQVK